MIFKLSVWALHVLCLLFNALTGRFSWHPMSCIPPLCMLGDSIKGLRFPSARRERPGKTTKVFLTKQEPPSPSGKCMENKLQEKRSGIFPTSTTTTNYMGCSVTVSRLSSCDLSDVGQQQVDEFEMCSFKPSWGPNTQSSCNVLNTVGAYHLRLELLQNISQAFSGMFLANKDPLWHPHDHDWDIVTLMWHISARHIVKTCENHL